MFSVIAVHEYPDVIIGKIYKVYDIKEEWATGNPNFLVYLSNEHWCWVPADCFKPIS
jgi:hypothetical protein